MRRNSILVILSGESVTAVSDVLLLLSILYQGLVVGEDKGDRLSTYIRSIHVLIERDTS